MHDVGKPKATVAAERVMARVKGVTVVPHHCRIEEKPDEFYKDFHIIVLGLDSLEARSYINSVVCSFLGEKLDRFLFSVSGDRLLQYCKHLSMPVYQQKLVWLHHFVVKTLVMSSSFMLGAFVFCNHCALAKDGSSHDGSIPLWQSTMLMERLT